MLGRVLLRLLRTFVERLYRLGCGGRTATRLYRFSVGGCKFPEEMLLETLGFLQVAVRPQLFERYDRIAVIPEVSWRLYRLCFELS